MGEVYIQKRGLHTIPHYLEMIVRTSATVVFCLAALAAFVSGETNMGDFENAWGEFDSTKLAPSQLSLSDLVQIGDGRYVKPPGYTYHDITISKSGRFNL